MNPSLQPGTHLDADQLSMFVDGKARTHERERMLAHLGQCAECRRVVFLMQSPAEPEASTSAARTIWTWRRWTMPMTGAALACSLLLAVYLWRHRGPGEIGGQSAQVQAPAPSPGAAREANNAATPKETGQAKSGSGQPETSPKRGKQEGARGGGPEKMLRRTPEPASGAAPEKEPGPVNAAGVSPGAGEKIADARAEAEVARPPATVPQPKLAQTSRVAEDATKSPSLAAAKSLPPLRIEHDRGPEGGASEVTGRVTDASGAVVPGAQISLRDNTGTTRETTSGGDGKFNLAGVPPGHYELKVEAPGFETSRQEMDLKSRDLAMLDSVLTVGAATETVSVQSEAPTLETESASVAAREIAALPSHLPATNTVALGKRVLSLDNAGTIFVSRNGGRSWKRVKTQWAGKVAQIEVTNSGGNVSKRNKASSGAENAPDKFRLTTDSGAVWMSNDGAHWRAE